MPFSVSEAYTGWRTSSSQFGSVTMAISSELFPKADATIRLLMFFWNQIKQCWYKLKTLGQSKLRPDPDKFYSKYVLNGFIFGFSTSYFTHWLNFSIAKQCSKRVFWFFMKSQFKASKIPEKYQIWAKIPFYFFNTRCLLKLLFLTRLIT